MKALIQSSRTYEDGYYIAQIEEAEFDVASDWFWVECGNDVTVARHYYVQSSNTFPVRQEILDLEAQAEANAQAEAEAEANAEEEPTE